MTLTTVVPGVLRVAAAIPDPPFELIRDGVSAGFDIALTQAVCTEYVVTLAGTLEFTTRDGETFVLSSGDVLLADDTTGTGHRWRLIDDAPWRRLYMELESQDVDK